MDTDQTQSGAGEVAGSSAGESSSKASYVQMENANGADLGQQVATDPLRYNPVNCPRQVNTSSLSSQSGTNPVQMLPNQQFNQLVQGRQMSQLHQMTAANYLKLRQQQMGMKTGGLQQLQQQFGLHPHLNSGISSPQLHQALSPQNNLTNLQQNPLSGVSTISNSPQHVINRVQPGSSFDLGQITMQELATGCLQQNPVNSPQQFIKSSFISQSGTNPVQENLGSLQQNSNVLQQSLPKQHEQRMLQNQLLMADANDLKMRQQMGMNIGVLQPQQFVPQSAGSHHPPLRSAISSPQFRQALSPQNNLTNLQQNSLSGVSTISNSPQHMMNTVQPGSRFDLGQMTMQELATGCLQQNPVNSPQQFNKSSVSSQSGTNRVQPNQGSQLLNSKWSNLLLQEEIFQRQQFHLMKLQQGMNSFQKLMQQNDLTNLQNNSLSRLPTISNRVINMVQRGSSLDLGQGNSLQQVATGSLQQNPVNSPQVNISSQSETNRVQANLGSLQQNPIVLQQMLQTQQLQMQLMQLQQALQQQIGMNAGVLQQQQSVGHSQLESGISSSQLNQALSPQGKEKGKVEGDVTLQMEFEPFTATVQAPTAQTGIANGADQQVEVYQKAQNKCTLETPLLGSSPQDMASDGLGYGGIVVRVSVLLLLVLIGWVLLLKD